ncbi:hypothetical protein ACU60T_25255 [Klebsiella aerogenes]
MLARQYRQRPTFIRRGLEACTRAGLSSRYFVDRYLHRRDILQHDGFTRHYLSLLQEEQQLCEQ